MIERMLVYMCIFTPLPVSYYMALSVYVFPLLSGPVSLYVCKPLLSPEALPVQRSLTPRTQSVSLRPRRV